MIELQGGDQSAIPGVIYLPQLASLGDQDKAEGSLNKVSFYGQRGGVQQIILQVHALRKLVQWTRRHDQLTFSHKIFSRE